MIKQLKQVMKSIVDSVDIWIERKIVQASPLALTETSSMDYRGCDYILQIQIKKCSDSLFWYHREIGGTFMVEAQDQDRYWVREPDEHRCLNFVLKKDAVVL